MSTTTEYSSEFSDFQQSTDLTTTSDFGSGTVLPQDPPPWPGPGPKQRLDLEILGATDLEFDLANVFQYGGGGVSEMYTF